MNTTKLEQQSLLHRQGPEARRRGIPAIGRLRREQHISTQAMLLRSAVRALRVVKKHKGAHPSLAALQPQLLVVVERFAMLFEAGGRTRTAVDGLGMRPRIDELARAIACWCAVLAVDRSDEAVRFGRAVGMEEVIGEGQQLRRVLAAHGPDSATPLPYAESAEAQLARQIPLAQAECSALRSRRLDDPDPGQTLEQAANSLHTHLIALRRILNVLLGPTHVDCEQLQLPTDDPMRASEGSRPAPPAPRRRQSGIFFCRPPAVQDGQHPALVKAKALPSPKDDATILSADDGNRQTLTWPKRDDSTLLS